ncbi:MAG: amidohydrolase [Bacillota bacterium]|nr:amidohydrolase [Bacillota bacterium]
MSSADTIIYSTKIYPGFGDALISGGIVIKGDYILAVGSREEIDCYSRDAEIIDYGNLPVVPGFIDSHQHYPMNILMETTGFELYDAPSPEFCAEAARKALAAHPDAPVIYAMGWQLNNWEACDIKPNRHMLDEVTSEKPICLGSDDGWTFWVNSKALEFMDFRKGNIPDDLKGLIQVDKDGEPTGILNGNAASKAFYIINYLPQKDSEKIAKAAFSKYIEYGVTSFGEVSNEFNKCDREIGTFDLMERLYSGKDGGKIPRMFYYPCIGRDGDFTTVDKLRNRYLPDVIDPALKDKIELRGLKGYIDGVMSLNTSVMLCDYLTEPKNGIPIYTQEALNTLVAKANAEGYAVRIHATGDGGVRMCLDAYEYSIQQNGRHGLRNCIEHIESCSEEDRKRFKELDVIAAINPGHAILEENLENIISEKTFYNLHPFRGLLDQGAVVSLSTDAPIVTCNPMFTIYAAVTRCDENGKLMLPKPNETMTIWEALEGYMARSAYTMGVEDRIGILEAGKLADIAVLDTDITSVKNPEEILHTKVIATYLSGKNIFNVKKNNPSPPDQITV